MGTSTKFDAIAEAIDAEAIQAEIKAVQNIDSSKLTATLVDYSKVSGYYTNEKVTVEKKGKDGAKEDAYNLINSTLKEQLKKQITEKLKAQGVSFEKIQTVFDNAFKAAINGAVDECVDGKHSTLFRSSKSWFNTKDLVDSFINKFNSVLPSYVEEFKNSQEEFTAVDIDFTVLGKDEKGKYVTDADGKPATDADGNKIDFEKLYTTGQTITVKKRGADYFTSVAEKILDGLKAQMMQKARTLCLSKGVEFNMDKFNTMFNNAKGIAVAAAVSGVDSSGQKYTDAVSGSAIGAGVGGAGVLAAGLLAIFAGGHHSESSLNTKTLIDTFTQAFKEEFNNWVDSEKA